MSTTAVRMGGTDASIGLRIHAVVIALLASINLLTVPEFQWFVFPTIGMSVGLGVHYLLGHWLPGRRARQS